MRFPEEKGLMEKNFQMDDVVMVHSTMSSMDGKVGKIKGKPCVGMCDFYIVVFDQPPEDSRPDTAIFLTEACLKIA